MTVTHKHARPRVSRRWFLIKLRADLVCMHYSGMGRHLFIDVAVTEPATVTMTRGVRSAATVTGYE